MSIEASRSGLAPRTGEVASGLPSTAASRRPPATIAATVTASTVAGRETGSDGALIGRVERRGARTAAAADSTISAASISRPCSASRVDSDLTVLSWLATAEAMTAAIPVVTIARTCGRASGASATRISTPMPAAPSAPRAKVR